MFHKIKMLWLRLLNNAYLCGNVCDCEKRENRTEHDTNRLSAKEEILSTILCIVKYMTTSVQIIKYSVKMPGKNNNEKTTMCQLCVDC